ncbi:LysM peptidoglycan-binding domain-containing protein [Streptomyces bicolor]|uniref:LysM peptidoglycan-binding domain-containing protein n=1 Tax=Streptomyces bicolor TaxID=66874 RepID=UPI0004E164B5|nr:LysM peptidoglycan-binding domain-containing protein [Streptomyces bicolor]
MRTTHSPAAAAGRTLGRALTAVLSLLILVGAVAGLPLLLSWVTPVIWASSHDDLTHLLDRQDTGSVFLLLLVAVGWIGWAQFTFCAVRELIAQLRGRTWHAPRGLASSQRAAALLIGSILVLLPTSSALASDAQAAPAATAARLPAQAPQTEEGEPAATSAASTPASGAYTVRERRPAESLWSIAERELGDGERWRQIAALNEGRTMTDGQVFRANSFLQPGWQLQMPDETASTEGARTLLGDEAPAAAEESAHVVTVEAGDYLSKIAEEELGDGAKWPELFEASQGKPQPHGLPAITNPDVVYTGQQVTVPGGQPDQHDSAPNSAEQDDSGSQQRTPPAAEDPHNEHEGGQQQGNPAPGQSASPAPEPSAPATESSRTAGQHEQDQASPSATASATPAPSASASPSGAAPSASADPSASSASTASESPATAPSSSPLNLRTVLGAGALLAAAVTGALALRRTLQRRRRNPGEKIAIAPETSTAEAQLAAAAEPASAALLDLALRTLAHRVAQAEATALLPPLRAARIGARALQVLPEDLSQEPQAPFVSGQGGWWVLASDAVLLDEEAAREVPAPYPGLVTVGSTESGALVLLNLAQLPALLLDGNPVHISEVCTSLALELGMSPWASDVEVVTIGFGEDLPQLLPTARIAHMRQAAHALRDLSERLLEAHQMPETQHQPYLLLCATSLDADSAWQFSDVIDKSGTVPVTLVAPASAAAAHFPEAEVLNASLSELQNLDYAGIDITVQRLEHTAYQQITTALAVSGQPPGPPEGAWREVPGEPAPQKQAELADFPWTDEPASGIEPAGPEQDTDEEILDDADTGAGTSAPAARNGIGEGFFPALLAASPSPAGMRLLPPAPHQTPDNPQEMPPARSPQAPAPQRPQSTAPEPDTQRARSPETEPDDSHAPQIRVLGPVEVDGVASSGHGPRIAQLAALMYFRPGRNADALCTDMDPLTPWEVSTLNARLRGLRSALGNDPTGNAYVPRRKTGDDPYRLSPAIRCDWTRFLQLAEHALPQGPTGLPHLEDALALVRGKPFGTRPLPWAEPLQQEMTTRIVDIAHTVARYRTQAGPQHDLNKARQAITTGLDADTSAELLYRDWIRIEHAAGNRQGLHTAISRIQHINRTLDTSLEIETEQLINELTHVLQAC